MNRALPLGVGHAGDCTRIVTRPPVPHARCARPQQDQAMTSSENTPTEVRQISAVVEYDSRSKQLIIKLDPASEKRAVEVDGVKLFHNAGQLNQQEEWFGRPFPRRP